MNYHASEQAISEGFIEGGIPITAEQYQKAKTHFFSGGRITIKDGALFLGSFDKKTVYNIETGEPLELFEDDETPEGYTEVSPEPEPLPPQPQPIEASEKALTHGTPEFELFTWMTLLSNTDLVVMNAVNRINQNTTAMSWQWQKDRKAASSGLDTAFNMLWYAIQVGEYDLPENAIQIIEDWRDEFNLRPENFEPS